MTTKIFYFLVIIFSVGIFFGLVNNGFDADLVPNTKIASMSATNINSYEINKDLISAKYQAQKIVRYKEFDEIFDFKAIYKDENLHELSADTAIIENKIVTLKQNALYKNLDENLTYSSNEIIYDEKFLTSPNDFIITQNFDTITGKSGIYDIKNKKINALNIKGNFIK